MAFVPRLSTTSPTPMQGNGWYYSTSSNQYHGGYNIYQDSGFGLPNCTAYAYGRYAEIRNAWANLPSGNGGDWYDSATGFNKGSVPKLGAVACYKSRSGNYAGHVAVVEQINSDGSIITSNSAWHGTYFFLETAYPANGYTTNWMTTSRDYYCQGFIYNDAGGTQISDNAYVIAAICGCWYVESRCNPGQWESGIVMPWNYIYSQQDPNKGGYGLGQWTNTGVGSMRLLNMHDWMVANGYADDDGGAELEYFANVEKVWFNKPETIGNYSTLDEYLNSSSTDITTLVKDFMMDWEGGYAPWCINPDAYGDPYAIATRIQYAHTAYDYIVLHANDDPNDYQWISQNSMLTYDEWLNNVMCIFFWLYSGTSPTHDKKKSILTSPLYLAIKHKNIIYHKRRN